MKKRALITGVCGQDGSYLAELLLAKDYEVFGLVRRTSTPTQVVPDVHIITGDMTDQGSLNRAVIDSAPDEVYNLAAQSFVGASWTVPVSTADITGLGALRLLEALRTHCPEAKFYQASSSEMFGNQSGLLDETAPFKPRSPYGFSKVFAHNAAINYRESYGMFVACGILFNHESPRRGAEFVTQKIIQQAEEIVDGNRKNFLLGNIDIKRDWGYAKEYVEAMWLMLQQDEPDDFVIATGQSHSIRKFIHELAGYVGLENFGIERDFAFYRPAEINDMRGNAQKAKAKLGWKPKVELPELVKLMWDGDDD